MPTGLTYSSLQAALVVQLATTSNDANFITMLPLAIDYAEQRIYRDLDFLINRAVTSLGALTISVPSIVVPTTIVEISSVFYGTTNIPVPFTTLDYIQVVYGTATAGPPEYVAFVGNNTTTPGYELMFGPAPDQAYAVSFYGASRPAVLSATNTQTWLSLNLPDLFFAACMVWISGYMKNYGTAGTIDDPQMGMSWEKQYELLKASAMAEETRRKFKIMEPANG